MFGALEQISLSFASFGFNQLERNLVGRTAESKRRELDQMMDELRTF